MKIPFFSTPSACLSFILMNLSRISKRPKSVSTIFIFSYFCSIFIKPTIPLIGTNHTYNLINLSPNFNVEKSHSYLCANVTVPKELAQADELQVIFSGLKLQAFMEKAKNGEFSSGKCDTIVGTQRGTNVLPYPSYY